MQCGRCQLKFRKIEVVNLRAVPEHRSSQMQSDWFSHIFKFNKNWRKSRPLLRVQIPALLHNLINFRWTTVGRLHFIALLHMLDHFGERNSRVRHSAERVDLPQKNCKAPDLIRWQIVRISSWKRDENDHNAIQCIEYIRPIYLRICSVSMLPVPSTWREICRPLNCRILHGIAQNRPPKPNKKENSLSSNSKSISTLHHSLWQRSPRIQAHYERLNRDEPHDATPGRSCRHRCRMRRRSDLSW